MESLSLLLNLPKTGKERLTEALDPILREYDKYAEVIQCVESSDTKVNKLYSRNSPLTL